MYRMSAKVEIYEQYIELDSGLYIEDIDEVEIVRESFKSGARTSVYLKRNNRVVMWTDGGFNRYATDELIERLQQFFKDNIDSYELSIRSV